MPPFPALKSSTKAAGDDAASNGRCQISISVETSITRISRDRKSTALSNICTFTFVNVDAELHPYPTTYAEDARDLTGYRHHQAYCEAHATPNLPMLWFMLLSSLSERQPYRRWPTTSCGFFLWTLSAVCIYLV